MHLLRIASAFCCAAAGAAASANVDAAKRQSSDVLASVDMITSIAVRRSDHCGYEPGIGKHPRRFPDKSVAVSGGLLVRGLEQRAPERAFYSNRKIIMNVRERQGCCRIDAAVADKNSDHLAVLIEERGA